MKLLERDGRRLRVWGLDTIDGTPVLDVKPYVPDLDGPPPVEREELDDPRVDIERDVRHRDLESLFADSAALHGGYRPLLAAGVLASTYAARDLGGLMTRGIVADVETGGDGH